MATKPRKALTEKQLKARAAIINKMTTPLTCLVASTSTGDHPYTYKGYDASVPDTQSFYMTRNNSWGAMAVWMTMTTSSAMALTISDANLAQFAASIGMTVPCVKAIRAIAQNPLYADAFTKVSKAFESLPTPDDDYPPKFCPHLMDIPCRMPFLRTMSMEKVTPKGSRSAKSAPKKKTPGKK